MDAPRVSREDAGQYFDTAERSVVRYRGGRRSGVRALANLDQPPPSADAVSS